MLERTAEKREFLERDLLRDFFLIARDLEEQFRRFEQSGTVSFPALHHLLGDSLGTGLLWRVKDNAHLLFREPAAPAGRLLDWTMGYIFHEACKLMEDARLRQTYIPRLADFQKETVPGALADLLADFSSIRRQTRESIEREINRLKSLISLTISLLRHYFAGRRDHRPLARFLYDYNELVRSVLKDEYACLLSAIYGESPLTMYLEAAESLALSARRSEALAALGLALACGPSGPEAGICQRRLEEISALAGPALAE
ncbi:MAG: hypothetical protein LBJ82_04285 [Deltaproteobacteria bacterium]|jgi:hypothetical protein|nr:hypothetical protein [Deltaproteobacteria bacterium]